MSERLTPEAYAGFKKVAEEVRSLISLTESLNLTVQGPEVSLVATEAASIEGDSELRSDGRPPFSGHEFHNPLAYRGGKILAYIGRTIRSLGSISSGLVHTLNALVFYGVPYTLFTTLAGMVYTWQTTIATVATAVPMTLPLFGLCVAAGLTLGALHYYYLNVRDETKETSDSFGWFRGKDKPNTLGVEPATTRQLTHVTEKVAKLVTLEEFKALGYVTERSEKDQDGFCVLRDGTVYVVLNKPKWFKRKENKDNPSEIGPFRIRQKGERDAYSLAHELGHALELKAFGTSGHLGQFHETNPHIMSQLVDAVTRGLRKSWFHDSSPPGEPHPLDDKVRMLEAQERDAKRMIAAGMDVPDDPDQETAADVQAEIDEQQSHWNYAELFAETLALYLTRPDWFKSNYPDAAFFFRNFVNGSEISAYLVLE